MSIPLAKWLQTYVATNQKGKEHKVGLEKLKSWCGQAERPIWKFRKALEKAITELITLGVLTDGYVGEYDIFYYKRSV